VTYPSTQKKGVPYRFSKKSKRVIRPLTKENKVPLEFGLGWNRGFAENRRLGENAKSRGIRERIRPYIITGRGRHIVSENTMGNAAQECQKKKEIQVAGNIPVGAKDPAVGEKNCGRAAGIGEQCLRKFDDQAP